MATDSLWTNPAGRSYPKPKLFNVPYLNAAISTWGKTPTNCPPQHEWIPDFIEHNRDCDSVNEFAERLEERAVSDFGLIKRVSGQISGQPRAGLGFHIAGYEDGRRVFFNINNNPSKGVPKLTDGNKASVKSENRCQEARNRPQPGVGWLIHNGDWEGFRLFFEMFKQFKSQIGSGSDPVQLPATGQIEDYGKYLGLMIMFIGGIWQLSNMSDVNPSHIGGDIHVLMMTPEGTVEGERMTLGMTGEGLVLR